MKAARRHPLKHAYGLGAAHAGVKHWWLQRLSALALIPLSLWFVALVLGLLHADYKTACSAVGKPWNALLLILFVVVMVWHTVLGLQVVIEDYVHTRWKEVFLLLLIKFLAVLGALASVLAVLRVALGA